MASFKLPQLQPDNDLWGPASGSDALPTELKDIPFAPYAKSDKVGRIADWNNASGASNDAANARGGRQGRARDVQQNFGTSAASSAFAYFHGDDEASFSVVDNTRTAASRRGGLGQMSQRGARGGRGGGAGAAGGRGASKFGAGATRGARGGRGGAAARRGGGRFGWKEWDKPQRIREASVTVGQDWEQVEEIDFVRLGKLRLEVEEPEDISMYGALFEYDRSYDRVTVKTAQNLSSIDRIRYNPTTSDDPVIQEISAKQDAKIFMTDSILALLMCATRSVYSWDIIITKTADGKVFFDKRDGGPFDYLTVNENAADPPAEAPEGKENEAAAKANALNTPSALSLEATYVNQNFAFQIVNEKNVYKLEHENPFYSADETDPRILRNSCGGAFAQ